MAKGRRKKIITLDKREIAEGFKSIRKEGQHTAEELRKAFENVSVKAKLSLEEAFPDGGARGLKDIELSLKAQEKAIKDLREQYKKAKADFDAIEVTNTSDPALIQKRREAKKLYQEINTEIKAESQTLEKQKEAHRLVSAEMEKQLNKSVTFYTQMRNIQEEMRTLTLKGQDQTPEYEKLRAKLDEVSLAYNKVRQEQQMMAKYGNMLVPGLVQGLSGFSGGFSAFQGVTSLFVKDNERLAAVQTKLQAAMAITIGLQQVQQTLHKTSAFRVGVVSKVTQAWNVAQTSLNTTLGISAGLMTALATGGVMALVAGVGYLITKYREWNAEQKKLEEITKSYVGALASEQARLDYLFNTYKTAEKGTKEYENAKKGILEQFDKYYKGLDAERLLAERTAEAYQKLATAIRGAAKDKALQETYEKSAKKLIDKGAEKYLDLYTKIIGRIGEVEGKPLFEKIKKQIEETGDLSKDLLDEINSKEEFYRETTKSDKDGNTWAEKTDINEVHDLAKDAVKVIKKAKEEYDKEISQATSVLGIFSDSKDDPNPEVEAINSLIEAQKKLRKDAEKMPETTEEEIRAKNIKIATIDKEISRLQKLGIEEDKRIPKAVAKKQDFSSLFADKEYEYRKAQIKEKEKLLDIEEEQEIESFQKRAEENKFTEEETQKYITLTRKLYALKREQNRKEESEKVQQELERSLEDFKTFEERKTEIQERYDALREKAKGDKRYDPALIDEANKKEVQDLINSFFPDVNINSVLDLTRATTKELVKELSNVREKLKEATDAKEVESLQNRIENILDRLENKAPFVAFKENLEKAIKDGVVDFELLGDALNSLLPELSGIASDARGLFGDGTGDFLDGLTNAIGGVADLASSVGSFMSGDIAGGISGLLSAGNKLFGNAIKVNKEHREALRLLEMQRNQLEHQYKIAELMSQIEQKKSLFGSDSWGQSRRAAEVYASSIIDLKESIKNLKDVEVVTDSRKSGWGPWAKRRDVWSSVLETYPKLIDSNGKFNKTLAETILSTQKLTDEGKFSMQTAIDIADVMEKAYTQMSENLTAVFGDLGQSIMEAFSDAFNDKTLDGFSKAIDSAGDMLESLAKQMIYSVTLQPIMEKASEEMMKIQLSSDGDTAKLNSMMNIISSLMKDVQGQEDKVNNLLDYTKKEAERQGFEFASDRKDTQASRGMGVAFTQDSITGLLGGVTALRESSERIFSNTSDIAKGIQQQGVVLAEQMNAMYQLGLGSMWHLADINKNTKELYGIKDSIQKIERNTSKL